jgi:hypothetical protein
MTKRSETPLLGVIVPPFTVTGHRARSAHPLGGRSIQETIADPIKGELAAGEQQPPGEPLRLRLPRYESNTAAATAVLRERITSRRG